MDRYFKPGEQISGYSIKKILGEGRYGIVYLAENRHLEKCIIKQLKKKMLRRTQDKLFYEAEILQKLDSPYFPKFIEKIETKTFYGYAMEYIPGTVFEDYLALEGHLFTKKEIYELALKLLCILEVLQHNHIVHRDIRLPNVIQKENKELVLIDFGLARYITSETYVKEMDYWYLGDFLLHLYYTSYEPHDDAVEKPWYEELDLTPQEEAFLKKLMGIDSCYDTIQEIKSDLLLLNPQH